MSSGWPDDENPEGERAASLDREPYANDEPGTKPATERTLCKHNSALAI